MWVRQSQLCCACDGDFLCSLHASSPALRLPRFQIVCVRAQRAGLAAYTVESFPRRWRDERCLRRRLLKVTARAYITHGDAQPCCVEAWSLRCVEAGPPPSRGLIGSLRCRGERRTEYFSDG